MGYVCPIFTHELHSALNPFGTLMEYATITGMNAVLSWRRWHRVHTPASGGVGGRVPK